jgi:hypothetical protein
LGPIWLEITIKSTVTRKMCWNRNKPFYIYKGLIQWQTAISSVLPMTNVHTWEQCHPYTEVCPLARTSAISNRLRQAIVSLYLAMLKIINNLADKISVCIYMMQISSMYMGHEEDLNFILFNYFQSKCPLGNGPWWPLRMDGIANNPILQLKAVYAVNGIGSITQKTNPIYRLDYIKLKQSLD